MADRRFEFEIAASDESFRRAMEKVSQEAKQAGAAVGGAFKQAERDAGAAEAVFGKISGTIAGLVSVGGALQFGRAIAASTIEAERSVALLNTTLRSTGYAAGLSGQQVEELVQELAGLSTFDDDPIRQGVVSLLRFQEVSGTAFKDASRLALDLAAATGKDVPSAFAAVGKALQDPLNGMRGLREAGVKLSEGQADLADKILRTGDRAGAQRLVLDELSKSVGGAAAGENVGLYGATRALANSWDDLLKVMGKSSSRIGGVGFIDDLTAALKSAQSLLGEGDVGERIKKLMADRDDILKSLSKMPYNSAPTAILSSQLDGIERRLARAREEQATEIASRASPSNRDARDLALGTDYDKLKADLAARAASAAGGGSSSGQSKIAGLGAQIYLDQFAELQRQAKVILDEAKKTRLEIEQEIIAGIGVGPELAAKKQKEFEDLAAKLVSETRIGQERLMLGVGGELDSLNEALIKGKVSVEEYEQAFEKLQERLNEVRGVQKDFAREMEDDQKEALKRIEFAVQGWGRQFTETLIDMVKTGKFEVSSLVDSIITDIARLAIQESITRPIFNAISQGLQGFGPNFWLGGSGGKGSSSAPPSAGIGYGAGSGLTLGTPKAGGGDVFPGMIYPINERGIEYFAPSVPGTVIPTNGMRGGGTTINLTIAPNVAAGADAATVRAAILDAATIAESNIAKRFRMGQ